MKVSFLSPQLTKWILKLTLLIIIVAIVSYIFFLNPDVVAVKLPSDVVWQSPLAMVLIVTFCVGLITASLVAIIIGFRQKVAAWLARKAEKQLMQNHLLLLEGREHKAAGDFNRAKFCFRRIIQSDPENILSRIFLAETLYNEGLYRDAITVLDDARQNQKDNIELLFLATQINEQLGNYTAAYDNLSLVLKIQPQNKVALNRLIEVAIKLQRYQDALTYQDKLIQISTAAKNPELQDQRAAIELESILSTKISSDELEHALEEILRRHHDYPPAIVKLAEIYDARHNSEGAIKLLSKAFKQSSNMKILNSMANIWQKHENPDKAVSTVKNALLMLPKDSEAAYRCSLFLCSFYIYLGMIDQALNELEKLQNDKQYCKQYYLFIAFLVSQAHKRRENFQESTNSLETALISTGLLQEAPFYFKT